MEEEFFFEEMFLLARSIRTFTFREPDTILVDEQVCILFVYIHFSASVWGVGWGGVAYLHKNIFKNVRQQEKKTFRVSLFIFM